MVDSFLYASTEANDSSVSLSGLPSFPFLLSPTAPPFQNDCATYCCNTAFCVAWVYASAAPGAFGTCVAGGPCCYPKNQVTPENPLAIVTNALVTPAPYNDSRSPPALGIRSAVPLGGLGAGSFELRGDGTFHEWTIIKCVGDGCAPGSEGSHVHRVTPPLGCAARTPRRRRSSQCRTTRS